MAARERGLIARNSTNTFIEKAMGRGLVCRTFAEPATKRVEIDRLWPHSARGSKEVAFMIRAPFKPVSLLFNFSSWRMPHACSGKDNPHAWLHDPHAASAARRAAVR